MKLDIIKTKDSELIKNILSIEEIKDAFPPWEEFKNEENNFGKTIIFYVMNVDNNVAGLGLFLDFSKESGYPGTFTIDVGILPEYRGKIGTKLQRIGILKFIKEFKCKSLLASINKENRAAILNAMWLGFKNIGGKDNKIYMKFKGLKNQRDWYL